MKLDPEGHELYELWASIPMEENASDADRALIDQANEQILFVSLGKRCCDMLVGFFAVFTPAQRAALGDAILEGRVVFLWSGA